MSPLERYGAELEAERLRPDPIQQTLVEKLDALAKQLNELEPWSPPRIGLLGMFGASRKRARPGPRGLYVWGGVGRGKTRLCDLLHDSLDPTVRLRLHFHTFMKRIHDGLRERSEMEDPLPDVAIEWARKTRLLLLDEMHVNDITDAMLLGRLLQELFERGVTLVTTSNVPPKGLYAGGLQRARFEPAIDAILAHCEVFELASDTDYRLKLLQSDSIYLVGPFRDGQADAQTTEHLRAHFKRLGGGEEPRAGRIEVNGRPIRVMAEHGDVVWFDFAALCRTPRSTLDFIEIADRYNTVLLSNVPILDDLSNDAARRLLNLVDEFYDRGVKCVVTAQAPPHELYQGTRLAFEFERAASRLTEMQSQAYLSAERRH